MSNADMSRVVTVTGLDFPFRAYPWKGIEDDGTIEWQIEYQQDASGYWGPRGSFEERNGSFFTAGREFASVEDLLRFRNDNPAGIS